MKFNKVLQNHNHVTPFFAGPSLPSAQAIAGGTTKLTATTTMGAAAAWTFLAIGTSVTLMWTGSVGWCAIGQGSMINGTGSAGGVNIGITTASS